MLIIWDSESWADCVGCQSKDKKTAKRIREPFDRCVESVISGKETKAKIVTLLKLGFELDELASAGMT